MVVEFIDPGWLYCSEIISDLEILATVRPLRLGVKPNPFSVKPNFALVVNCYRVSQIHGAPDYLMVG